MKIKFCGAARTVTGSSHLIMLDDGFTVLLDCGLYQGGDPDFDDFNKEWSFEPKDIDVMVLSHAHIDHAGRIPKLTKDGFKGDIVCTSATRDLSAIMLMDSAYIQERNAAYASRKAKRLGRDPIEPLYNSEDALESLNQFVGISYGRWMRIGPKVEVIFRDAGHILGSSSVCLRVEQSDRTYKYVGFSGDIGRPDRPILRDPVRIQACDYLICESTYGGQDHQGAPNDEQDLLNVIKHTCVEKGGKLIIPAFSVGRTQEIVYMLDRLESSKKLPSIPVYVDSPLAVNATDIFVAHPECYDQQLLNYLKDDSNPFGFNKLKYIRSVDASKAINESKQPAIIISASGMMQAGRVKHHLNNCIEDSRNTILVVGFCAEGTLGRLIRDGEEKVTIFGKEKNVKAEVVVMDSFSAHGDEDEMVDFLRDQDHTKLKKIFLVHGEIDRQELFKNRLINEGYRKVEIPVLNQTYNLD